MKWSWKGWRFGALVPTCRAVDAPAAAQETVCARVKVKLKPEWARDPVAVTGHPVHW